MAMLLWGRKLERGWAYGAGGAWSPAVRGVRKLQTTLSAKFRCGMQLYLASPMLPHSSGYRYRACMANRSCMASRHERRRPGACAVPHSGCPGNCGAVTLCKCLSLTALLQTAPTRRWGLCERKPWPLCSSSCSRQRLQPTPRSPQPTMIARRSLRAGSCRGEAKW